MDENIGKTYGHYTIIGLDNERCTDGHKKYIVQCSCGKVVKTQIANIKYVEKSEYCNHVWRINGVVCQKSCFTNKNLRHIFYLMLQRCYNPNTKDYKNYGQKGVCICQEWLNNPDKFEQWSYTHGYKKGLTIDRIHEEGNYSPDNCRWVTLQENARFRSNTNYITATVTLSGRQWASLIPSVGCNYINKLYKAKGEKATVEFIEQQLQNKHLLKPNDVQ